MKLAWQNIIHDRSRFSVTVLGASFAVFLMVCVGSLVVGFLRAASRLIDARDRDLIAVPALPTEVEINRHRARIERQIQGYGAFLGVPFLFTSYRNAIRYLGFGPDDAMYVVLRVSKGSSVADVKQSLQERLPEVDVLTRDEFAHKSR